MTKLPEWGDGELLIRVPEPDDKDWPGSWQVQLLRAGTDLRVALETFECRDMAIAKAVAIARVVYQNLFTEGTVGQHEPRPEPGTDCPGE